MSQPLPSWAHRVLPVVFKGFELVTSHSWQMRKLSELAARESPHSSILRIVGTAPVMVAGIGFGSHKKGAVQGPSNAAIARIVKEMYFILNDGTRDVSVAAQWDVAQGLPSDILPDCLIGEPSEPHIESRRFVNEVAEHARRSGIRYVVLAGQINHARRVMEMFTIRGFVVFVPEGCGESIPFDRSRENTQWWCGDLFLWWEICATLREKLGEIWRLLR